MLGLEDGALHHNEILCLRAGVHPEPGLSGGRNKITNNLSPLYYTITLCRW